MIDFDKKEKIALAVILITICLILFVSGYLCFLKPIYTACILFDIGRLTGKYIFWMILKMIIGWFASGIIYLCGMIIAKFIIDS